jgi:hypothetical protein
MVMTDDADVITAGHLDVAVGRHEDVGRLQVPVAAPPRPHAITHARTHANKRARTHAPARTHAHTRTPTRKQAWLYTAPRVGRAAGRGPGGGLRCADRAWGMGAAFAPHGGGGGWGGGRSPVPRSVWWKLSALWGHGG